MRCRLVACDIVSGTQSAMQSVTKALHFRRVLRIWLARPSGCGFAARSSGGITTHSPVSPQFRGQFHPTLDALVRGGILPLSESTERVDAQWLEEISDPAHDRTAVVRVNRVGVRHVHMPGPQNILDG